MGFETSSVVDISADILLKEILRSWSPRTATSVAVSIVSWREALFLGVQKSFFWGDTKDQSDFFRHRSLFWGYKMLFFGIQKMILTFSEVKWGLTNCFIVPDILEGQKRQGWVFSTVGDPKSSSKSSRKQQHTKQEKQHKEAAQNMKSSTNRSKQRHEGPESGAPKVSFCFHWRLLVEFPFFQDFFEKIPMIFIKNGYRVFCEQWGANQL